MRDRVAEPSPQVVVQGAQLVHGPYEASTLQQVPPLSMERTSVALPGQADPPHAALQDRDREFVDVCVTQFPDHDVHELQTPLMALMQQSLSVLIETSGQVDEQAYDGMIHVRVRVRDDWPHVGDHEPADH